MRERDGYQPGVHVPEARTQTREAPAPDHRGPTHPIGAASTVLQLLFALQGA